MENSRRLKGGMDGKLADWREARGQGGKDALINRVSDSAHFCPWDESSCAHRRSASWGIVGNKRLFSLVVFAHRGCVLQAIPRSQRASPPKTNRFSIQMQVQAHKHEHMKADGVTYFFWRHGLLGKVKQRRVIV